jgi:hypothetical protein
MKRGAATVEIQVKDADPQQGRPAAEAVGGPAARQRSDHRTIQRGGHRDAMQPGAEPPEFLDGLFGSGNDNRVEAKEKSGEGRNKGEEEDAVHSFGDSVGFFQMESSS